MGSGQGAEGRAARLKQRQAPELLPRRLLVGLAFVAILMALGVAGFMGLEHISFLDAMLTTVSAISTVGYSPPRPLSVEGKILAILLIVGGLFGIALVISTLTEYFMEGHLHHAWERWRMDRAITALENHFIISGFGRVGREVARQFVAAKVPFIVVDVNPEPVAAARAAGYLIVEQDASDVEALRQVGIERARGLVACADSDMSNVYVTLTARHANPSIFIVARAAHADAEPKLLAAGANRVVSPYVMAGRQMAELAARPRVADYLNLLFDGKEIDVQIQEIIVDGGSIMTGRTVRDLHDSVLDGAFVLAIDRANERMRHVAANEIIMPGDRLLVVGSGVQLEKIAKIN